MNHNIPCECVLRSIFRICHERFTQLATTEKYMSRVTLEIHSGPDRRGTWGRKEEEFMADFINLAKRTLSEDEYRMFRYRFLLGADWRLCTRKLGIDRGTFFNTIYRIQEKLARVFAEVEPYALFPVSEYFFTPFGRERVTPCTQPLSKVVPIRPPMAKRPQVDQPVLKSA